MHFSLGTRNNYFKFGGNSRLFYGSNIYGSNIYLVENFIVNFTKG